MTAIPMLAPRINQYTWLESLTCRWRHRIPRGVVPVEHGFWRCFHPLNQERGLCGLWVYIQIVRGGGANITDVSSDEAATLNDLRLTPTDIIRELRKRRNVA